MPSLRPYQREAVRLIAKLISLGKRRIVLCIVTGGGKTIVITDITIRTLANSRRFLGIAHRLELIKQMFCKFVRNGVDPRHIGVVLAGIPDPSAHEPPLDLSVDDNTLWRLHARRRPVAPCQVGSVDTLRNRPLPQSDVVFIDEGHRSLSPTYLRIIDHYTAAGAVIIAATATPCRTDNRGLGEIITSARLDADEQPIKYPVYQDLVVVGSYNDLVRDGYLVAPRVWTVPAKDLPDLSRVRLAGSDYDPAELSVAVDQDGLVGNIVEHWVTHGGGEATIFFGVNREHAQHVRDRFNAAGIPATYVDGDMDKSTGGERERAFAEFAAGKYKVLCNVDVCTEGTDLPFVKTIVLGCPTKSLRKYLQMVGRGSRPFEGHLFTLLDHAGCTLEHGLPQADREWSLDPKPRKRRASIDMPAVKTCPTCYAVVPVQQRTCGAPRIDGSGPCDYVWVVQERILDEKKGRLVEVREASEAERREVWRTIVRGRGKRGARWCQEQYRNRFQVGVPRAWLEDVEPRVASEAEKKRDWERILREAEEGGWKPGAALSKYWGKHQERPKEEWTRDAGAMVSGSREDGRGHGEGQGGGGEGLQRDSTVPLAGAECAEVHQSWRQAPDYPEGNYSAPLEQAKKHVRAPRQDVELEDYAA